MLPLATAYNAAGREALFIFLTTTHAASVGLQRKLEQRTYPTGGIYAEAGEGLHLPMSFRVNISYTSLVRKIRV